MLQLKKIEHKGEIRILLKSDYDFEMKEKFKKLPNAKYSSTYRAWHIKYDKLAFNEFKKLNIPFEIIQTDGTIDTPKSNDDNTGNTNTVIHENLENLSSDADISKEKVVENVRIEWNNRHFYIFLSYSKLESEFIKSLDGSYWNAKYKNWVVDANLINIDALQTRYLAWDQTQYNTMVDIIKETLDPYKIQIFRTSQFIDKINIIIKGFRADIDFIKKSCFKIAF